jgi:hypothetical protein
VVVRVGFEACCHLEIADQKVIKIYGICLRAFGLTENEIRGFYIPMRNIYLLQGCADVHKAHYE